MSTYFLRPRVGDLVFHLYGRPLHPELFETLASRRIERPEFTLTVRITPTGHVITWESPTLYLTELTTSGDEELPNGRRLLHHRLRGEHSDTVAGLGGVSYQMSSQVEVLPPELFLHVHDDLLADGSKRGLLYHFPPHHRLALAPLGFITTEAWNGCLLLSSFHTFPDEHTVVKTQSLIERK
jgi:hypothetical protein